MEFLNEKKRGNFFSTNLSRSSSSYAIKELLNTERDYVNDLAILIEKYMEAIKQKEVPLPPEMEEGKTKIVFGNIQQIYEWHKRY